ncbi:MAG: M48 family metalloprotease, partial [Novosphingobium sp.]
SLMNNEAELGGVLGHETAHVALRHSAQRQSAATKNQIIGVVGAILSGVVLGGSSKIGQLLQSGFMQGSQLLTLKFSRKQESEADSYGVQYLRKAGYDPRAMSTVLQSLANQNALDARLLGTSDQVPEWASTHPDPASRVRTAAALAGTTTGITNRDTFLTRISGLTYGDSPAQGYAEGRSFKHPLEKIAFEAPAGYYLVNGTQAVAIGGTSGKGQFTTAAFDGNLDAYVTAQFATLAQSNQTQLNPSSIQHTTVNGIPAAYATARVANGGSQVDVTVFAYQWSTTQAYHFLTITQAGQNPFDSMFASMRRLSASEAAALKPRKLVVVSVKSSDTLQSLAARMAYTDAPLDRFLVLNGLTSTSRLAAGQKVKLVTY